MAPIFKSFLALAAALPFILAAPTQSLKIRSVAGVEEVPGRYIVVFKENVAPSLIDAHKIGARQLAKRSGDPVEIDAEYDMDKFKGYAVAADEAAIEKLAASDEVSLHYIFPTIST